MTTVLVVDDRATNREIARATLDRGGYRVLEAVEGRQALAIARSDHPDVVLTDVLMPGMDGYQFVRELREDPATADIPVLFYTATCREDEAQPLAGACGVSRVLSKSAGPAELLQAVDAARHLTTVNAELLEKAQALDESEARFAAMAEACPMGIVIGDRHGRATYVNPRLSEITGIPAAELLGEGWQCCLGEEHRGALHTGADGRRHQERITIGETVRWLTVLVRAVRDREGVATGFVATIDDVTEVVADDERRHDEQHEREREARRQATARFDSLARLAGGVAHDFNNLLNVVLSFGEFVQEAVTEAGGTFLTAEQARAILDDVEQIHRAGQRAAHLTHQLLAFGGREVVTPAPVNLNSLVDQVCELVGGTIGRHVTVSARLDAQLRPVLADASQLTQILINLVVNARDAMPDGGRLHLSTANTSTGACPHLAGLPAGDYVHVAVTDTGHGMSADVARQAMEPFYTTKPRGQGTGLGLATSYGVIKQAGGDLVIDSNPGHGTTMHIYLPATDQPAQQPPPTGTGAAAAGRTVLVAEDEDGVRDAVVRLLVRAGYEVLPAANGRDALTIAERHDETIHALLTDVVMPVMNGRELAEALHRIRPEIPVLFMSGYAAPLMTEQGLLEAGVTVLGKPFTKADLLAALDALIARPVVSAV
ncbi:response regulator [Dactylosporangium sp. NPDC049525]|uniref:response regulator n=1 Tax=Dactylosporangium sp. NPDC049525 TaxID=3154730 RepID=UPI0034399C1E